MFKTLDYKIQKVIEKKSSFQISNINFIWKHINTYIAKVLT